jgi:Tfp pilus assembly protein PilW
MTRLLRDQRGYTLGELLVSAAVIAFIMAALLSLLMSGQQSYTMGAGRAEAQQNARLVIERMLRELRTAGHDPQASSTFAAVTALGAGTGFVIRNDWNGNALIDAAVQTTVDGVAHGETITYTFAGTTLTRQESTVDAQAVTVTDRISSMTVTYLDADDVAVATPSGINAANIRTVVLDITTQPDFATSGTATQVAVRSQNRVRIRNR